MDKDNEIELVQTIQEKDKKIKELETINENITRELLSRTEKLSEVLEKQKDTVPKDKIRKLEDMWNDNIWNTTDEASEEKAEMIRDVYRGLLDE